MAIELVPHKGIGPIQLGMTKQNLPELTSLEADFGKWKGVNFMITEGRVTEVWIDDIRTFGEEILFQGKPIDPQATGESLRSLFAPCSLVEGLIGGHAYDCSEGIRLGFDVSDEERSVQIRLK